MGMKKGKAMMLLGMAAAFSGEYPDIDESIEQAQNALINEILNL